MGSLLFFELPLGFAYLSLYETDAPQNDQGKDRMAEGAGAH